MIRFLSLGIRGLPRESVELLFSCVYEWRDFS